MSENISETENADQKQDDTAFTVTEDMQSFIDILKAGGVTTSLQGEEEQHAFVTKYHAWTKAGKPRPALPDLQIEDPIPMKLYRIKYYGKQKIFWRDTEGELHGKTLVEKTVTRPITDAYGKSSNIIQRDSPAVSYSIDYSKIEGEAMVKDALARCLHPTFYFIERDGKKYSVSPDDFNGDFDKIVKQHKENKYFGFGF